jgi:hypothetical protein
MQLSRYLLGGPHAPLYEALRDRQGQNISARILFAASDSPYLAKDRLAERGSNRASIMASLDSLPTHLSSLQFVEMRRHKEPYLWRLMFFDDVAFVSGYLVDKKNDESAFVYQLRDRNMSLYKIFDKYFEHLWDKYDNH